MGASGWPLVFTVFSAVALVVGGLAALIWPNSRLWGLGRRAQVHSWNAWAYEDMEGSERSTAGRAMVRIVGAIFICIAIAISISQLA